MNSSHSGLICRPNAGLGVTFSGLEFDDKPKPKLRTFTKVYMWKLLKDGQMLEPEFHGPDWDEFRLNVGPFKHAIAAELALNEYLNKYYDYYTDGDDVNRRSHEEFVMIEVYSDQG